MGDGWWAVGGGRKVLGWWCETGGVCVCVWMASGLILSHLRPDFCLSVNLSRCPDFTLTETFFSFSCLPSQCFDSVRASLELRLLSAAAPNPPPHLHNETVGFQLSRSPAPWRDSQLFRTAFTLYSGSYGCTSVNCTFKCLAKLCGRRSQGLISLTGPVRQHYKTIFHPNELIPP